MRTSCHRLEVIRASESAVAEAAKAWWEANGYKLYRSVNSTHLSAFRGSSIGVTDQQTRRIMEVILKKAGDSTAVSVYHHTSRILLIVGVMFSDILELETDSFMRHIQEHAVTKC